MLQPFGAEIWIASGPIIAVAGFRYPTRMAVIRLAAGELFVWSPTALTDELKAAVDALGEVRHVVAPSTLHDLFLSEWRAAYPDAELLAPPGLRERRKNLAFDGDFRQRFGPRLVRRDRPRSGPGQLHHHRGRVLPPREQHGDLH